MEWAWLAFMSAVGFSAYAILQKHVLERLGGDVYALGFWGGLFHLVPAIFILTLQPPTQWLSAPVLVMLFAGALNAAIILTVYYVVHRTPDISRVVPVIDAYPIFVVLLAVFFLGEMLTPLKGLAVGLVVTGALLAAMHQGLPGSRIRLDSGFFVMLAAGFGIGVYTVLAKFATGELSVWQLYALTWVASFPCYVLAVHAFRGWDKVRAMGASRPVLRMALLTHATLFVALVASFMALALGPASLAAAIMATRPLIVLLWMALIGFHWSRSWSNAYAWGGIGSKGLAALLVTAGVAAMALP